MSLEDYHDLTYWADDYAEAAEAGHERMAEREGRKMATPATQKPPPTKAPAAPAKPIVSLASAKRGKLTTPMRIAIYGIAGVGKSSFAAEAPSPIFLDTEEGSTKLDVARVDVAGWLEAMAWIDELTRGEHDYKTVVIDTIDALEQKLWRYLCEKNNWDSIEEPGYGKGYTTALEHWRDLLSKIERLRNARGMHVIFCGHAMVKSWKNPEGNDFDRHQFKIHEKSAGLIKGWCETVLFAKYEVFAVEDSKTKRHKGVSGDRVLCTQQTAVWDAKNRDDLPETLPLDWNEFMIAAKDPARLRARIESMLATVTDETRKAGVIAAVNKSPDDGAYLARVADKLSAIINIEAQENAE